MNQDQVLTLQLPKHLSFEETIVDNTYVVFIAKDNVMTVNEVVQMKANTVGDKMDIVSLTHPGVKYPLRRSGAVYGKFMVNYLLLQVKPDTNRF